VSWQAGKAAGRHGGPLKGCLRTIADQISTAPQRAVLAEKGLARGPAASGMEPPAERSLRGMAGRPLMADSVSSPKFREPAFRKAAVYIKGRFVASSRMRTIGH